MKPMWNWMIFSNSLFKSWSYVEKEAGVIGKKMVDNFQASTKSLMYSINKTGPRTEP